MVVKGKRRYGRSWTAYRTASFVFGTKIAFQISMRFPRLDNQDSRVFVLWSLGER